MILNVDFELKLSNYTSLKHFICLKMLHSQYKYLHSRILPFNLSFFFFSSADKETLAGAIICSIDSKLRNYVYLLTANENVKNFDQIRLLGLSYLHSTVSRWLHIKIAVWVYDLHGFNGGFNNRHCASLSIRNHHY